MINPQTTPFIAGVTGAIGWVLALIAGGLYWALRARHKTLQEKHNTLATQTKQIALELKGLQRKTAEPFRNDQQEKTMPKRYVLVGEDLIEV